MCLVKHKKIISTDILFFFTLSRKYLISLLILYKIDVFYWLIYFNIQNVLSYMSVYNVWHWQLLIKGGFPSQEVYVNIKHQKQIEVCTIEEILERKSTWKKQKRKYNYKEVSL